MPNYFDQTVTFDSETGPTEVPLRVIDDMNLYNVKICINYGSQIGASIATLIVLLLLVRPDKRLSTIMVINTLSLILNIVRNVLQCLFFTGPWMELYAALIGDFSHVHMTDYAISITATVFTLLLQVCVELSLCLQVRVVCVTLRDLYQHIILAISAFIALVAIGCRFAYMIENDKYIVTAQFPTGLLKLGMAANYTTAITIFWFSAVFVIKLGFALRQRAKMGLRQFGPMQILFIMGCQTLVIPAVLSLLQCWDISPALSSNALTACAIFLPLSSLWASASLDNRPRTAKQNHDPFANYQSTFSNPSTCRNTSSGPLSPTTTVTTLGASGIGSDPMNLKEVAENQVYVDLEKQVLAHTGDLNNKKI